MRGDAVQYHSNGDKTGCSILLNHWFYSHFCVLAALAIFLLSVLELPGLCWEKNDPNFRSIGLPAIVIIQLTIIIFLGVDAGLRAIFNKNTALFWYLRLLGRTAILFIMIVDAIATVISREPHPMLLWGFQCLLVIDTINLSNAHRHLHQVIGLIKSVSDILFMILTILAFFIAFEFLERSRH